MWQLVLWNGSKLRSIMNKKKKLKKINRYMEDEESQKNIKQKQKAVRTMPDLPRI